MKRKVDEMDETINDADLDFLSRIENGVSLSKLNRDQWESTVSTTLEDEVAKLERAGLLRHSAPEESLSKQFSDRELCGFFDPSSLPSKGGKNKLAKLAVEFADHETLNQLLAMCPVYEATAEGRIAADEYREIKEARERAAIRRDRLSFLKNQLPQARANPEVFPFVHWCGSSLEAKCSTCRKNDGKIFSVDAIKEFPPPYCDCVDSCHSALIPMTKEMAEDAVKEKTAKWAFPTKPAPAESHS